MRLFRVCAQQRACVQSTDGVHPPCPPPHRHPQVCAGAPTAGGAGAGERTMHTLAHPHAAAYQPQVGQGGGRWCAKSGVRKAEGDGWELSCRGRLRLLGNVRASQRQLRTAMPLPTTCFLLCSLSPLRAMPLSTARSPRRPPSLQPAGLPGWRAPAAGSPLPCLGGGARLQQAYRWRAAPAAGAGGAQRHQWVGVWRAIRVGKGWAQRCALTRVYQLLWLPSAPDCRVLLLLTQPLPALRPHPAALSALTTITLSGVPTVSDETLRLVGQRHSAVAALLLCGCAAVMGSGLGQHGAFPALRSLVLDGCDSVTG